MALRDDAAVVALPDAPGWRSVVEGYSDQESYEPGETVRVHCSSAVPEFSVTVTRVGADRTVVWSREGIDGTLHPAPDDAYSKGCGWPASFEIPIGNDWVSGYYEIRFVWPGSSASPDGGTYACFVVRPVAGSRNPLLVLATSTWQAYNEWGGSGLYRGTPVVSLDRPYDRGFLYKRADLQAVRVADVGQPPDPQQRRLRDYLISSGYGLRAANAGWFEWERRFAGWAETNGYTLDYAVSSDLEARPELLKDKALMLSVGHDEYWSAGMRGAVETFASQGGNVAFLGGDLCTSKIRYSPGYRTWTSYVMQGDLAADPDWPDGDFTGLWSDPALANPETRLTGVSTMFAGYARFGTATPRGGRGFLVQQPDHWILDGTDVAWGDSIGADGCLAGFELGGCDVELRSNRFVPTGRFGTPPEAQILAVAPAHLWRAGESSDLFDEEGVWADSVLMCARLLYGDNPPEGAIERLSNGWASMLVHQPGGTIFTAATTEWAYCLDDPVIDRMSRNILDRLADRNGESLT
jgi:hypothetical protein